MLILSKEEINQILDWSEAIEAIGQGFTALSAGKAAVPLRGAFEVPGKNAVLFTMPGFDGGEAVAIKIVSVFRDNPAKGLPLIYGLVTLLDGNSGQPLALFDGATVTAIRTGAASGVATKYLAIPEAKVLALFGAGVQAETQLLAIAAVRKLQEVRVYSRNQESATKFAERLGQQTGLNILVSRSPTETLQGAQIIATATTSSTPVFADGEVEPGAHINGVGSFTHEMREVPGETVARALVVVDAREGCMAEAGDILIPLNQGLFEASHIQAELGEVVAGKHPGRSSLEQLTFFKSVGNAVQDVALASYLYQKAQSLGLGVRVEL